MSTRRLLISSLTMACAISLPAARALEAADATASNNPVEISEVHCRPLAAHGKTEFLEIVNRGKEPMDLSGWRLTKGVRFQFPEKTMLAAGARAVVCEHADSFRQAFGREVHALGQYEGRLDNAGELLRLEDAAGRTVTDFEYGGAAPWPDGAETGGLSLQRIRLDADADDPANWCARPPTPGAACPVQMPEATLSLYQVRREPSKPVAGEAITIFAEAWHARPLVTATLEYEVGGRRKRLPMKKAPARSEGPRGRTSFTSTIPPQSAGTIVRYSVELQDDARATARSPHPRGTKPPDAMPTHAFFVQGDVATKLPLYSLFLQPWSLEKLQPGSNTLVPATFVAGAEVYDGVRVRGRGAWARTWPKMSWKVIFSPDRKFRKRSRINLNSAWHDPAFIRETLAYEVFRDCGAPSLESRMVRLHVNGELWGIFSEVESPKKSYLARQGFRGASLYKAMSRANASDERDMRSAEVYALHYEIETKGSGSFEDLWRFCRDAAAAEEPAAFLQREVDLARYIDFLCACVLTQNWDHLNKNHFLIHDREGSKKWLALPWDLDRTFGDHWSWRFDVADVAVQCGTQASPGTTGWNRLQDRFFSDAALTSRFYKRLSELLRDTFTEEKLHQRVDALRDSIEAEASLDRERWGGDQDWRGAIEGVKSFITRRRAFLLGEIPGGEPETPLNKSPAPDVIVNSFPIVLSASPFRHADGGLHRASRWQVRAEGASWSTPAVHRESAAALEALQLEKGILFPRTKYFWRVAHVAESGKCSQFSSETPFTTGRFPMDFVKLDLSSHFNRDVVVDPGDGAEHFIDERGGQLLADGFDGQSSGNPLAQGLPLDHKVGMHILGDYNAFNTLQLTRSTRRKVRVIVPPGRYSFVRFLLTGGAGDSRVPVQFEYSDGTRGEGIIPCDDWYDDLPPGDPAGRLQPGVVPALNDLDRLRGSFKDRNEPALFEVILKTDAARQLKAFVLDPARAEYDQPGLTTFNLFAATGVVLRAD